MKEENKYGKQCWETDRYKALNKIFTFSNKKINWRIKRMWPKYECYENGMRKWKKKVCMVNNGETPIDIKR